MKKIKFQLRYNKLKSKNITLRSERLKGGTRTIFTILRLLKNKITNKNNQKNYMGK